MSDPEDAQILLVEDSAEDAEMTLRAMRKCELASRVHWVKDGEEALEYLFCSGRYAGRSPAQGPKLVLLDIKMPRVDGIEVLRRVKGSELKSLPVVVMTSSNEERDVLESYRLGVNSYIRKPVDFNQFVEAVKQLGLYWLVLNQPVPT